MAGEGWGFRGENWTLGEGQPLFKKGIKGGSSLFHSGLCKYAQLPHRFHFFVFKSFVPVLTIERDLVITEDSCLTAVLLHATVHSSASFTLSVFLFSPCSTSSAAQTCYPRTRTNVLWPQRFFLKFFFAKESATREAVTTCYRRIAARCLSREEKLQENPLGPR